MAAGMATVLGWRRWSRRIQRRRGGQRPAGGLPHISRLAGSGGEEDSRRVGVAWNPVVVQVVCIVQVQVTFGGFCCGLRGESLAPLPVLATPTPSDTVHLLKGIAIGALVQRHYKGILRNSSIKEMMRPVNSMGYAGFRVRLQAFLLMSLLLIHDAISPSKSTRAYKCWAGTGLRVGPPDSVSGWAGLQRACAAGRLGVFFSGSLRHRLVSGAHTAASRPWLAVMVGASVIVSAARTPHAPPPRARQGSRLITPPRSPESGGRRPRRPFSTQRLNWSTRWRSSTPCLRFLLPRFHRRGDELFVSQPRRRRDSAAATRMNTRNLRDKFEFRKGKRGTEEAEFRGGLISFLQLV
uniref:Uncharacterized protein n=1 Tax=Oryza meridionalis TaxID=40149 RepID=A0A0E0CHV2_9ORYZ